MSKIAAELFASPTHIRKAVSTIRAAHTLEDPLKSFSYVEGHKITLTFEANLSISPAASDAERRFLIHQTKRAIIEEVLGEFRPTINELYRALLDYDVEKALQITERLEKEIYEVPA